MDRKSNAPRGRFKLSSKSSLKVRTQNEIASEALKINLSVGPDEALAEGVNGVLAEYFVKMNLPKTLEQFNRERALMKETKGPFEECAQSLLAHFAKGSREDFFSLWGRHVPRYLREHDQQTVVVEFYLTVYFTIFKIHPFACPNNGIPDTSEVEKAYAEFKAYLLAQGEQLTKIEELLPYFALPYLKDPQNHPFFKAIFTREWVEDLRRSLEGFLRKPTTISSTPTLLQMFETYQQSKKISGFQSKFSLKNITEKLKSKNKFGETRVQLEPFSGAHLFTNNEKHLMSLCEKTISILQKNDLLDDELTTQINEKIRSIKSLAPETMRSHLPSPGVDFPELKKELFELLQSTSSQAESSARELFNSLTLLLLISEESQLRRMLIDIKNSDFFGKENAGSSVWLSEILSNSGEEFASLLEVILLLLVKDENTLDYASQINKRNPKSEIKAVNEACRILTNQKLFLSSQNIIYQFLRSPDASVHAERISFNVTDNGNGTILPGRQTIDQGRLSYSQLTNLISKDRSARNTIDHQVSVIGSDTNYLLQNTYGPDSKENTHPANDAFFAMNAQRDEMSDGSEEIFIRTNEVEDFASPMQRTSEFVETKEDPRTSTILVENQLKNVIKPSHFKEDKNMMFESIGVANDLQEPLKKKSQTTGVEEISLPSLKSFKSKENKVEKEPLSKTGSQIKKQASFSKVSKKSK